MQKLASLFVLLLAFIGTSQGANDFLKPDQAFAISAKAEANGIRVTWDIADGYYLYQSKFRFKSNNKEVVLGAPDMPPGKMKKDEIFGEIEIYQHQVALLIPLKSDQPLPQLLELETRSQGCADAGICYPPHTQNLVVALAQSNDQPPPVNRQAAAEMQSTLDDIVGSGSSSSSASSSPDPLAELGALGDSLGIPEDDIIPVEKAFQFSAEVTDGHNLHLHWDIADETYLYSDAVKISIENEGVSIGQYELPAAKIKHDSVKPDGSIGDVSVYVHEIDLNLPLVRTLLDATEIKLAAKYQGCADRGICYPPQKKTFTLSLPQVTASTGTGSIAPTANTSAAPQVADSEDLSEQDQIASILKSGKTWLILLTFYGFGLALAFTPCVFPMIPILSGIIAGHGHKITMGKAFSLSLVYVLAMAVTYTIAGVLAGLFGGNLQAAFQNPWILSAFAGLFVLLALSMFGFFELQLPPSWQAKLAEISNRQHGGHMTGAAIMGLLSALIVGPCVAPPLAAALIVIGQTGDWQIGGLALFTMSMGMGTPLIAIGTSAGKLLPKAGAWMDTVKAVFGITMLGLAIYMLERIIPEAVAMALWGLLLIVSATYMGALQQLPTEASGWHKLWKGLGLALLVYGALFFIGAASGGKDTLQPLRGVMMGGSGTAQAHLNFKPIKSISDLQRELATAKAAGKPVMLDFYADWCIYCKQMEKNTFSDPAVQAALADFVLLQADVTDQDETDLALQKKIDIIAPPAMIFWDTNGEERKNLRLLGFMGATDFAKHVNKL